MKIIKLNFLLLIVLAFCLGCSVDNSSLEEEEQIVLENESLILDKVSISNTNDKSNSTSNNSTSYRTENWVPDYTDNYIEEDTSQNSVTVTYLLIEYSTSPSPLTPAQKAAKRSQYASFVGFISYSQCSNDSNIEIWTVDEDILFCDGCIMGTPKLTVMETDNDIERAINTQDCEY